MDRPAINSFYKRHIANIGMLPKYIHINFSGQKLKVTLFWEQYIAPEKLKDFFKNKQLENLPDNIVWNFLGF